MLAPVAHLVGWLATSFGVGLFRLRGIGRANMALTFAGLVKSYTRMQSLIIFCRMQQPDLKELPAPNHPEVGSEAPLFVLTQPDLSLTAPVHQFAETSRGCAPHRKIKPGTQYEDRILHTPNHVHITYDVIPNANIDLKRRLGAAVNQR